MNADPINIIHTNQQSKKEGLKVELGGYFRLGNAINLSEQFWALQQSTTQNWELKIKKTLFDE